MKKIISLILAVLMLMSVLSVSVLAANEPREITVADGSVTSCSMPVYGSYSDQYQLNQCIYPASMFSDYGTITKMTFYTRTSQKEWPGATYCVALEEVTEEAFADKFLDYYNSKIVYEGEFSVKDNKMTIEFQTPYNYKRGNLLLTVYTKTPAEKWGNCDFFGINSKDASRRNCNKEGVSSTRYIAGTDFIPKTTFTFSDGTAESASTFGEGSGWVIAGIGGVVIIGGLAAMVVAKRKKKE